MKSRFFYCMAFILVLGTVGVLNAGAISVSICNEGTLPGSGSYMEATDLAGAPGVRVGNWNNWLKDDDILGDADQVLTDDSGATLTGFSATMNPHDRFATRDNNHDNDQEMFSDVVDVFDVVRSIVVTGVPYASYDVYVYMRDDGADRAGSFTIDTTTYYVRGGAGNPGSDGSGYVPSSDTTQGAGSDIDQGNYVYFSGVTGSSFTLDMEAVSGGGSLNRNKFCGFQIVERPVVAIVPEDRATAVPINQDLQWSVIDPNATHIDLYFGPENDPNLTTTPEYKLLSMEPVSTTTLDVGTLEYSTPYYWHIDIYEPNEVGPGSVKVAGVTWSFETETPAPVIQTYGNVITTMDLLPASLSAVVTDADNNLSSAAFAVTSSPAGSIYTLIEDVSDPYAPSATLDPNMPGTYEVTLTVTDADFNTDEVTALVDVYADACEAAQASPDWAGFNSMDFHQDCDVDLYDFVSFSLQWMDDRNLKSQVTY